MTITSVNEATRGVTRSTLIGGFNHVAQTTSDIDRLAAFYEEVFEVPFVELPADEGRHGFLLLGRGLSAADPGPVLHAFEVSEAVTGPLPDPDAFFRRGRLDHLAIEAAGEKELCEIRERLVDRGASDGAIRLLGGWFLSVHFVDPDGMRLEVGCRWTGEVLAEEDLEVNR
jgi:catechol 2,3-dioxygenase-like lactoylglutathione lyase family enzyme